VDNSCLGGKAVRREGGKQQQSLPDPEQ